MRIMLIALIIMIGAFVVPTGNILLRVKSLGDRYEIPAVAAPSSVQQPSAEGKLE
jgi:hypothetical protein